MTFGPSASSIASRIRPPVRGKVGAIAAAWKLGDKRCPGVFEPGLRSPPPHRWRATPRLTGLTGRCACIRSGSLRGGGTPIALELATTGGLFPSSRVGSRIHAMRANSSARRQVVRQQGRPVAKTRGASPQEATSCRDLESDPQGPLARVKNGCRARNARPLQGSRATRAKVSSTEETRAFHEVRCANRSWSAANERPRNCARAARSRRQAPEAVDDMPRREETPDEPSIDPSPKHATAT